MRCDGRSQHNNGSSPTNTISDPVGATIANASNQIRIWEELQHSVALVLVHLEAAVAYAHQIRNHAPEDDFTTRHEALRPDCDGWDLDRPCPRPHIRKFVIDGTTRKLCDTCRMRARRAGVAMIPYGVAARADHVPNRDATCDTFPTA